MSPDELLGDSVFGDFAEVFEVGTLLELVVHAVAEAVVIAAEKSHLVNTEGELDGATALLEAGKRVMAHLLRKAETQVGLFNLGLLVDQLHQFHFAHKHLLDSAIINGVLEAAVTALLLRVFFCH